MTKIPDYNMPRFDNVGWTPDKQEKFNLRYWKGKKAAQKRVPIAAAPQTGRTHKFRSIESKSVALSEGEKQILNAISQAHYTVHTTQEWLDTYLKRETGVEVASLCHRALIRLNHGEYELSSV